MSEIEAEVLSQLEAAQAEISDEAESVEGPPLTAEFKAAEIDDQLFGAGGVAKYVLVDHYFSTGVKILWTHVGVWRYAKLTSADEQGIAQIAFAASRLDTLYSGNKLSFVRCWKAF